MTTTLKAVSTAQPKVEKRTRTKATTKAIQSAQDSALIQPVLQEMEWLEALIQRAVNAFLHAENKSWEIKPPELAKGYLKDLIAQYDFGLPERLVLALAIAEHFSPELLDHFLYQNPKTQKTFREFGGYIMRETGQFSPTLRTALFLLSGGDKKAWIAMHNHLHEGNVLFREQIINLNHITEINTYLPNCTIHLDSAYYKYLFDGTPPKLDAGDQFPATLMETNKTFDDLVLSDRMMDKLKPAINYVKVQRELYENADVLEKVNTGFVVMLYGPPGTGKTFTVSVLANELGVDAYKIDASMLVSKYIGETEKNLKRTFDRLDGKDCIVFFDEADAIFGKRTEVTDAKDRYANQEVSYLLQRIEKFKGLVVLATNHQNNLDDAFQRRIISKIFFSHPSPKERLQLWNKALPKGYTYAFPESVENLAHAYDFTGANIAVIVKMCIERAFAEGTTVISDENLLENVIFIGKDVLGVNFRPPILPS